MCSLLPVSTFAAAPLKLKNTTPAEGEAVSLLKEVTFEFDFSDIAAQIGVSEDELGILCGLKDKFKYRMVVYKGEKEDSWIDKLTPEDNEHIVATGYNTILKTQSVPGVHSVTIPLTTPVQLENGQAYTIFIPSGSIGAVYNGGIQSDAIIKEDIKVQIVGGEGSSTTALTHTSYAPTRETPIDQLESFTLNFDEEVSAKDGVYATLTNAGTECARSTNCTVNGNQVTFAFDPITLYKGAYILNVPSGVITSTDGSKVFDGIMVTYDGANYHHLETGRIFPSVNNPISWLGQVYIPFIFPEGYNIGQAYKVKAKLYEGSLEATPIELTCDGSDDLSQLVIDVWNFDLKPSTTYYVVLDEGSIFPASQADWHNTITTTTNPQIVLAYTTPAELESPAKVTVASSTPSEAVEEVSDASFTLAPYEFENRTYTVRMADADVKAVFSDGRSSKELPIAFTPADDGGTATIAIGETLYTGRDYTLTIPAGTFVPNANAALSAVAGNDEIVLHFTGTTVPTTVALTIRVVGQSEVKTEAAYNRPLTFTATPQADELWAVGDITLGGDVIATGAQTVTTSALTEDAVIEVALQWTGTIDYDFTTGVETLPECAYTVKDEPGHLTIDGLQAGSDVRVYDTVGHLLSHSQATDTKLRLTLPAGVYLIRVGEQTLKVMHK